MKILKFNTNRLKLDLVIEFIYCDINGYKYNYLYRKIWHYSIYFPLRFSRFHRKIKFKFSIEDVLFVIWFNLLNARSSLRGSYKCIN